MIARLAALIVLIYGLGFVLFAFTLGKPAPATRPRRTQPWFSPAGAAGLSMPSTLFAMARPGACSWPAPIRW